MEKILLSGQIAVPAEMADQAERQMELALKELVEKLPNAEFKKVYKWNQHWGWSEDKIDEKELSTIALDNSEMCEVQLPSDLAGEI